MSAAAHALLAALTLAFTPAMAQRACPVAADLAGGIRIDFADGGYEVYRSTGRAGLVVLDDVGAGGVVHRIELARGMHLLSRQAADDPLSRVDYDYSDTPERLPLPVELARWKTGVTVIGPGSARRSEPQSHAWGPLSMLTIGACEYEALEATISYAGTYSATEGLWVLPDLGLSYLAWREDVGTPRTNYDAIAIAVMP